MTRQGYNYDEIEALSARYEDLADEPPEDRVFALLVDVCDCYVSLLEAQARDHPAPYLGTTPTGCALNGLEDHLEMLRDGTREQLR